MSELSDGWFLAFGFSPGPAEMLVILGIALLLYGGRLPEMARSWGKTLAEFRRGLSGIQNELNEAMYTSPQNQLDYDPEQSPYSGDSGDSYSDDYGEDYNDDIEPSATEETAEADSSEEEITDETSGPDEPTKEKSTTADAD